MNLFLVALALLIFLGIWRSLEKAVIVKDENLIQTIKNYSKEFRCSPEELVSRAMTEYIYISEHLIGNPNLTMAFVEKNEFKVHTAYEPGHIPEYRRHKDDFED